MIRSRLVVATILAALIAGACGSTPPAPTVGAATVAPPASEVPATGAPATEAPAATPSPEATPSPAASEAAVDAAAAFRERMADPFLTARVTLDGTGSLGDTPVTVTGTLEIDGRSSHLVRTTTTGRSTATEELINAGGSRYRASGDLWFAEGAALSDDLVRTLVAADATVTDVGIDTVGGQALHHLTVTPPATLAGALPATAKGTSNFTGTMDAWVDDAGTPVLVRLSGEWDQPVGRKTAHATRTVDLAFSDVGDELAIDAPEAIWTWAASKRYGYRMAYPADWQFEPGKKRFMDGYWGYDGDVVFAYRTKSYGFTLNQVTQFVVKHAGDFTDGAKVKVTSNKPARLGRLAARVVTLSGTYKKDKYWWVAYIAVKGPWIHWIELRTEHKTTAEDKALAADFASTHSAK